MSTLTTYQIDKAIHPGRTLLENLEFLGMSQLELALKTEITPKHIGNIVNERASISPDFSLKLEKVLGVKAFFWDNLEKNYQATLARIADLKKTEEDLQILPSFQETYDELVKHKVLTRVRWIEKNYSEVIKDLQYFFGVESLKLIPDVQPVAFRKYERKNINPNTLSAVLRIGEKESEKIETTTYDENTLKEVLKKIKKLTLEKDCQIYIPKIKMLLASAGVSLICLPGFKNTHIQGATKWAKKDKAMILLKTTKQGEDRFWFNLLHEIGHLLKHGKKQTFLDLKDKIDSEEEKEADKFASDFFMKGFVPTDIEEFKSPITGKIETNKAVKNLAQKYQISQSIVAGRLSYEFNNSENIYRILNKFIPRINYNSLI